MGGQKFEYDDNSTFYFLLSVEAILIIPSTIYYLFSRRSSSTTDHEGLCHCENCSLKTSRLKDPWKKAKQKIIKCCLVVSWLVLFLTYYKVNSLTSHESVTFDPFMILEIDPEASMAEIKKAYRRLSLLYHPDKVAGDEKRFMMIAKAYSALTDAEARKNFELYGHPDGPGASSFGIALPSWIIADENSFLVLGAYAFLITLIAIGIFCYRSMNLKNECVLYATTKIYYRMICKTPNMIFKRVLMVIAASLEFEPSFNKEIIERESDNMEIPVLIKSLASVGLNEKNKEIPLCYSYSIKARALLYSHLSRLKLSNALDMDKTTIIRKIPLLVHEFISCIAQCTLVAYAGQIPHCPTLDTLDNAIKLSQCVTQALWNNQSSLLQLPHITEDMLKHFTSKRRNIKNVAQLAAMKEDDRQNLLRCLNDEQYADLCRVMNNMPSITLDVKAHVKGDDDPNVISVGSLVTVALTITRQSFSVFNVKEKASDNLNSVKEEKQTPVDGEVKVEEVKKKPPVWQTKKKVQKKSGKNSKSSNSLRANKRNGVMQTQTVLPKEKSEKSSDEDDEMKEKEDEEKEENSGDLPSSKEVEDDYLDQLREEKKKRDRNLFEKKSEKSHLVHCPFFPDQKYEGYYVYIADKKTHSLKTAPLLITSLYDKEEVEMQFSAPLKPGLYNYLVVIRSDSYLDLDITKVLQIHVTEATHSSEPIEISEEEEEEEEESAVEDPDLFSDDDDDEDKDE